MSSTFSRSIRGRPTAVPPCPTVPGFRERFQLEVQIQAERFLPGRAASGHPIQLLAINDAGLHWVESPFDRFAAVGCDPTG